MGIWTREKIAELKEDYFPGLDPIQVALKLFNNTSYGFVKAVENKLAELKLRPKKGYDI